MLASTPRRVAWACATLCALGLRTAAAAGALPHVITTELGVGPQYDSTHVYVTPADLDGFVASFVATFGGHAGKPVESTVTPTASSTQFQYIMSPVGTTLAKARAHGAAVLVEPIDTDDRRSTIVKFPGGYIAEIHSQLPKQAQPVR